MRPHVRTLALLLALAGAASCWVNPATGKSELSLINESDEIELGGLVDRNIVESVGIYDDHRLAQRVDVIGQHLAARSERRELAWTFRVLDDPSVNAFAVPGGHVYVTRGLLAHLANEAQLAAVLGHEIGHVTARHSINQISKAHLASRGLGLFQILNPSGRRPGLQRWLLEHGKEDELEADDLGARYLIRSGYDPSAMLDTLAMLDRLGALTHASTPQHTSTHPATRERLHRQRVALEGQVGRGALRAEAWMPLLEGLMVGADPRQGFLVGQRFIHPELNAQLDMPAGWPGWSQKDAAVSASPDGSGVVAVGIARDDDVKASESRFYATERIQKGAVFIERIGELDVIGHRFVAASEGGGVLFGVAVFVPRGNDVLIVLSLVSGSEVEAVQPTVDASILSIRPILDPALREVEPMRIRLVSLREAMTLREFQRIAPSVIILERLAVMNQIEPDQTLPAGTVIKRVDGFNPELLVSLPQALE